MNRGDIGLTASGGPIFFDAKENGEKETARSDAARGWHSANNPTGCTGPLRLQRELLFKSGVLDGICAVHHRFVRVSLSTVEREDPGLIEDGLC